MYFAAPVISKMFDVKIMTTSELVLFVPKIVDRFIYMLWYYALIVSAVYKICMCVFSPQNLYHYCSNEKCIERTCFTTLNASQMGYGNKFSR